MFNLSSKEASNIKLGTSNVNKLMLGTTQIFPSKLTYVQNKALDGGIGYAIDVDIGKSGTRLYSLSYSNSYIYQFNLSTANDITTLAYSKRTPTSLAFSLNTIAFKADGTKVYVSDGSSIKQYPLSTAWEVDSIGAVETTMSGIGCQDLSFSNNGLNMYAISASSIRHYTLSTSWNISTATLASTKPVSIGTIDTMLGKLSSDGTYIMIAGYDYTGNIGGDTTYIYKAILSSPYDTSSIGTLIRLYDLNIDCGTILGIEVNSTLKKIYIADNSSNSIREYSYV